MSGVFHVVFTDAPGVSGVPNPPGPDFQPAASKSAPYQPAPGFVVVYFQVDSCSRAVGTRVETFAGVGRGAQSLPSFGALSAHFFQTALSARSRMNTPPITGRAWNPA